MYNLNPLHSVNTHASAQEIAGQIRQVLQARVLSDGFNPRLTTDMDRAAAKRELAGWNLKGAEVLA